MQSGDMIVRLPTGQSTYISCGCARRLSQIRPILCSSDRSGASGTALIIHFLPRTPQRLPLSGPPLPRCKFLTRQLYVLRAEFFEGFRGYLIAKPEFGVTGASSSSTLRTLEADGPMCRAAAKSESRSAGPAA